MWKIVQAAGVFHSRGWQINRLLSVVKKSLSGLSWALTSCTFGHLEAHRAGLGSHSILGSPGTAPNWGKNTCTAPDPSVEMWDKTLLSRIGLYRETWAVWIWHYLYKPTTPSGLVVMEWCSRKRFRTDSLLGLWGWIMDWKSSRFFPE